MGFRGFRSWHVLRWLRRIGWWTSRSSCLKRKKRKWQTVPSTCSLGAPRRFGPTPERCRASFDLAMAGSVGIGGKNGRLLRGLVPMRLRCRVFEADAPTDERVVGLPQMDDQGNYLGPLQKRDWHGPEMIGKASGSFGTQGSEAWPREVCQAIANSACAELASDLDAKSPKAGEVAASRDACPSLLAATPPAASSGPGLRRPRR